MIRLVAGVVVRYLMNREGNVVYPPSRAITRVFCSAFILEQ